ncbi:hypothetical protein C2E19_15845 [Pseudomonas sp. DTU12.3]|uniref:hypothetical protein n=1 Tax=Pseudomonas sp. DTU12.3 TaxID=2073078 RepID=UPI0010128E8A|nr:hypothetical protein [Pseudomonas sp. DTU12.3]QAX85236.1 hypothetical protein C2E19_15845 [Pseudomonas sp. DTU12.3]
MTSFQAGTAGQVGAILVAPTPELPDGRGPNADIIPIAAIPVGGALTLTVKTNVWSAPVDRDQIALDVTRTQPSANPQPSEFTRLPRVSLGAVSGRPLDFPITVPTQFLGEDATPAGPTPIWVRSVLYQNGLNPLTGPVKQLFIDRTAVGQAKPLQTGTNPGQTPGAKTPPVFTFPNAPGDLDDTWANLPGNAAGLRVAIDRSYANPQPDDHVTLYVAGQRTNPPQVAPFFDGPMPANGEVVIPTVELRKVVTGRVFIWFIITDVAGNVSAWAVNFRNVRFLPLPKLGVVTVPANADGLIELKDARAGVTVEVTRLVDTLNTDVVSLKWGAQPARDLPFGALTKLVFQIAWADLSTEYFANQTGTDYEVDALVKADLMRAGLSIDDNLITVKTDFSTHPPYTVDPTTPPPEVNPEFRPLIVRGQPPVVDNTLGPQDVNQTATALIDLSPASGGTFPDPEAGDLATLMYLGDQGEIVVSSTPLDDTNINTVIRVPLPYSIVGPGGLGTKQVWWMYENPGRNNILAAAKTPLIVNTVVIVLEKPEFVRPPSDGSDPDLIICESLPGPTHEAVFRVLPNAHYVDGMDITFHWQGWHDAAYTIDAPVNTVFTETRAITGPELTAGMLFKVPYKPNVRDLPRPPDATPDPSEFYAGYVKVWNSTPTVPTSEVAEMIVYLLNADFLYCESEPGWEPAP